MGDPGTRWYVSSVGYDGDKMDVAVSDIVSYSLVVQLPRQLEGIPFFCFCFPISRFWRACFGQ